jgi:hypothetical protein
MKKQRFTFLLLVNLFTVSCSNTPSKYTIGAIEVIQVQELEYRARIDTGADTTSINAYNIVVDGEEPDLLANIGKVLHFNTANEKGDTQSIEAKIVKVNNVHNAIGNESRYVVLLALAWGDYVKTVEVNLRDRSRMQFALLIGRNWLKNDFIVDVSGEELRLKQKNDYIQRLLPRILTP